MLSLVIPSYGDVKNNLVIENENVNNTEEIDFEKTPTKDKIIITNVTKTTTITIPPEKTEATIKFAGDAINDDNTVQIKNDVTINATNMNAVIEIKSNTSISNENWNGEFIFSKIDTETIPDQENTVSFQIGNDLVSLSFNPPLKITFKDSANQNLFITSADKQRAQITTICDSSDVLQVTNIPNTYPKSCYTNVGNDLITITKQASVFSTSNDKTITKSEDKSTYKSFGGSGRTGVNVNPAIHGKLKFEDQPLNKILLGGWAQGNLGDTIFYWVIGDYVTFDNDLQYFDDKKSYPNWIKQPTMWLVEGTISTEEYISILRWLVDENIIN